MKMIELLGGLWALCAIALRTGFRPSRHPYWKWREETAFGTEARQQPSAAERRHVLLDFGRWVYRMRRRMH